MNSDNLHIVALVSLSKWIFRSARLSGCYYWYYLFFCNAQTIWYLVCVNLYLMKSVFYISSTYKIHFPFIDDIPWGQNNHRKTSAIKCKEILTVIIPLSSFIGLMPLQFRPRLAWKSRDVLTRTNRIKWAWQKMLLFDNFTDLIDISFPNFLFLLHQPLLLVWFRKYLGFTFWSILHSGIYVELSFICDGHYSQAFPVELDTVFGHHFGRMIFYLRRKQDDCIRLQKVALISLSK